MKAKFARVFCLLVVCWYLSACSQWRYDLGTPLNNIDLARKNMPLDEALDLLGPPVRMTATDTGFVLAWEHWHIREDAIGISLGALGADFMTVDWGEMRVKGEFLLLTFDKQHLLSSATHSEWDNYGGGGRAIQPFFGFVSLVDADDLTDSLPQHKWGSTLLQRLPASLNSNSSVRNSQNGLQQRGTTKGVGQQTLEMD